jgi:hypothetical protein
MGEAISTLPSTSRVLAYGRAGGVRECQRDDPAYCFALIDLVFLRVAARSRIHNPVHHSDGVRTRWLWDDYDIVHGNGGRAAAIGFRDFPEERQKPIEALLPGIAFKGVGVARETVRDGL